MNQIAIFASGAGSNARKIIEHFKNNPTIKVKLIVSNKPDAPVVSIAANYQIQTLIIEKEKFFRGNGYVDQLKEQGIDFIALAGFLWKIPQPIIDEYRNRIINIHPALLPRHGGKGMYGSRVHEAVLNAGEIRSGITIHLVDEKYDNGDIIFQKECDVENNDTPETLAERVHALEHYYYPRVIEKMLKLGGE